MLLLLLVLLLLAHDNGRMAIQTETHRLTAVEGLSTLGERTHTRAHMHNQLPHTHTLLDCPQTRNRLLENEIRTREAVRRSDVCTVPKFDSM